MPGLNTNRYGDLAPRRAGYEAKKFQEDAQPLIITERFGENYPLPSQSTKTMIIRKYEEITDATTPLTEGENPEGQTMSYTDIPATLEWWGDFIRITDQMITHHTDGIPAQMRKKLSRQAVRSLEKMRIDVIKGGTGITYPNSATVSARVDINDTVRLGMIRLVKRTLSGADADPYTSVVSASRKISTEPIGPSFIGMGHTDLEHDIREVPGFVPIEKYSNDMKAFPGEIGKVENIRFILTTLFTPWADAATNVDVGSWKSTGAEAPDVYPIVVVSPEAYAVVPLKGKNGVTPFMVYPKPQTGDELGMKGHAGWKTAQTALILDDTRMNRMEVLCTNVPS